jgi:hypothetical protein
MFLFQANGKDLLLGGPHSSSLEGANQYIADAFGSAHVAYTMMETRTGIVRAMRHLVMPPSFVAAMKKALGGVPAGHDGPSIESWVGIGNTAGAWTSKNTMRWTWDDRRKGFGPGLA